MPYDLPTYKTTVVVEPSGRVFVNDVLCAQITGPGRISEGGGAVVVTRDDLAHQLRLHSCADQVRCTLDEVIAYVERQGLAAGVEVDAKYKVAGKKATVRDYSEFGYGLINALLGNDPNPGFPEREKGDRLGRMIWSMRHHLAKEQEAWGSEEVADAGPR